MESITFVISEQYIESILRDIISHPYHVAVGRIGLNSVGSRLEVIARSYELVHEGELDSLDIGAHFQLYFSPFTILRPQAYQALALTLLWQRGNEGGVPIKRV